MANQLDLSRKLLSDIITYTKYSRFLPEKKRRETWEELVTRNKEMHMKKFPQLKEEIDNAYRFVYEKKVLPSMRSLQFAGKPIELQPNRLYNCSYAPVDSWEIFHEVMFLLLGGSGVGYSVQQQHIRKLPEIKGLSKRTKRYIISDSIEGWADAIKVLVRAYFLGESNPIFDYADIRPKGSLLKTSGGKAPGPQPLKDCIHNIRKVFDQKKPGDKLTSLEAHDILCFIADAVLSGGIRRAAMIALFSVNDEEMLSCKYGKWYELNPQRARANNSVVILRHKIKKDKFLDLWKKIELSGSGEPGILFSNNGDYGINPCKPLNSLILTPEGYITFKEALTKNSLKVVLPSGEIANATKPFLTGKNQIVSRILLSNGNYLYGTPNHLHKTADGSWLPIEDLQIGDHLEFNNHKVHTDTTNNKEYELGLLAGWVHGDGWLAKRKDASGYNMGMCFGHHELDVAEYFENVLEIKTIPHPQKPNTCRIFNTHNSAICGKLINTGIFLDKNDLSWLYNKTSSFKLGFLKAVFTADGSVRKQNNVELYSTRKKALEVISNILKEFGIYNTISIHNYAKSYIASDGKPRNNSTTFKINVYAGQFKNIGFISKFKNDQLNKQEIKDIYRYKNYVSIIDIEPEYSVEDVYDISVDHPSHSFIDTGVTTHNCAEISLRPHGFCNLTTINGTTIVDQADFEARTKAAAFIGTLQASYTDFIYLRDVWKETAEKDALIGVSITGIAIDSFLNTLDIEAGSKAVVTENKRVAKIIGIKPAARCTTLKPEGSSSLLLGTSSGIHAWHAKRYIRRMRLLKTEALYKYLNKNIPELVEDDYFKPKLEGIATFPIEAPEGAITRKEESAIDLLNRVKKIYSEWILPGHIKGDNTNNVSATISIKENEWEEVGEWMWKNRDYYNSLSVLPFDNGTYIQAPFEECSKAAYEIYSKYAKALDLSQIIEDKDETDLQGELACAGGACLI